MNEPPCPPARHAPGALAPAPLIVRYHAIAREEAYLTRRFGTVYRDYQARVRRWF